MRSSTSKKLDPLFNWIPIAITISILWYTASVYQQLPSKIPIHFGFSGYPDAYSQKSFGSVFLLPVLSVVLTALMTLLTNFLIIRPEDPGRFINLPQKQKELLGPKKLEELRNIMARSMQWLTLIMSVMFAYIQYGSINTALGRQSGLGPAAIVFIILILAVSGYMVKKSLDYSFYRLPRQ